MTALEKIEKIRKFREEYSYSYECDKLLQTILKSFDTMKEMLLEYYEGPWTDDELMHEFEKRMKT